MAAFTPVVSTKFGAEGLFLAAGEHYFPADSVKEWESSITGLVENAALWHRLRSQARLAVERSCEWNVIGQNLR